MTGTELLMEVADGFRVEGEAQDILIVYSDENSNVCVKGNCNMTRALGLSVYATAHIQDELVKSAK